MLFYSLSVQYGNYDTCTQVIFIFFSDRTLNRIKWQISYYMVMARSVKYQSDEKITLKK